MRQYGVALAAVVASSFVPGCSCGDDPVAMPDAEVEPDAEAEPDAENPDAEPDLPPAPVTGFTAAEDGASEVDLTWTNPADADLAGVLVVVSTAAITFSPTDGTAYTASQDLGGGQTVLFVDDAEAASLTGAALGQLYQFRAWAFDDATQYSTAASTFGRGDPALPAQTATISISIAGGTVTVTSPPADLTLTGGSVSYNDGADTLDVDLTVQNDTPRLLFNLKALKGAQNEGGSSDPLFPATGGQPYLYYGPEALDVGASAARTLHLTGITGATDPITVELSFVDAPMLFTGSYNLRLTDASGSGETDEVTTGVEWIRQAAVSSDGRRLFLGSKIDPRVVVVDTTTMTPALGADLGDAASDLGSTGGLALTPDGSRLFVLLTDGTHWNGGNGVENDGPGMINTEVQLVELDPSTLAEVQRLTLRTDDTSFRVGRQIRVSDDGGRAAIVMSSAAAGNNELWLVDLATFTVIGGQPIALSTAGAAFQCVWRGDDVIVGFNSHSTWLAVDTPIPYDVVDTATSTVTQGPTMATSGRNATYLEARGGKLYYASTSRGAGIDGLHVVVGDTATPITGIDDSTGVVFHPDGTRYYVLGERHLGNSATVVDAATDLPIDTDGDADNGATPFSTGYTGGHTLAITPF